MNSLLLFFGKIDGLAWSSLDVVIIINSFFRDIKFIRIMNEEAFLPLLQ